MDTLTAYETAEALAKSACSRLPIYGGVYKHKREFIAKSVEEPFDIAILKLRTQRLRKWKPDVYMQYVKTPDGFEKLQRYRTESKTISITYYRRKKSFTNKKSELWKKLWTSAVQSPH